MKYTRLEGIDKDISKLAYGTPLCLMEGKVEESMACLETAYNYGFRVFDTAHSYGKAEEMIGIWMKECHRRSDVVLHDKGFNPGQNDSDDIFSADTIKAQIEMSLERLQTDYLDFYVLHRDDESKDSAEIIDVLNQYKKQKIIGRFGVSNWSLKRLKEANAYAEKNGLEGFSSCSPCYSLADFERDPWGGSIAISGEQNQDYRDWLSENQMPVFNYSALARGYMSGMYKTYVNKPIEEMLWWGPIQEYHSPKNEVRLKRVEEMAREKNCGVSTISLAWLMAQPMNLFPIVNPTGEKHIEEAIAALSLKLSQEESSWLMDKCL